MHVLLLNQYFPPDEAPTGILMSEIARAMQMRGHSVELLSVPQDYRASQTGKGRMIREFKALVHLLKEGVLARRPDLVFGGSSPPCAVVVESVVALRHGAKLVHWAMDLYPEIAEAFGEVRRGLPLSIIDRIVTFAYRACSRVVVLDDDMVLKMKARGIVPLILRPWVLDSFFTAAPLFPSANQPWTWVYSGNLGRAHEWETLLAAQAILEKQGLPIRLRFQGGGPSWPLARKRADELGLKACDWRSYVPANQLQTTLLEAHCGVVTQSPAARGLLWPSKLSLLLTLPRPILFVGPVDGAIARELSALPHSGIFAPGNAAGVAEWIRGRFEAGPGATAITPQITDPVAHRNMEINRWCELLESAVC